jgi:ABC-type multidrug transport system ATPase subunit
LNGVQLEVRAGEVHALLGENGAGKSTLMHILAGVYHPDAGTLRFNGEEVRFADARAAQKAGVAMVFQERSLAGPLSVAENVFFGRQPSRRCGVIDHREMHRQTRRILAELGVDIEPTTLVEHLAPAEQQMVEIAKALSLDARLLVLDEPTRGIDMGTKREVHQLLRELAREGTAVVFISSELPEVLGVADRILVMREGRIAGELSPTAATEEAILRLAALLRNTALDGVMACGMVVLMVAGVFDLSVGSMFSMIGVLTAWMMTAGHVPVPLAILAGLGIAAGGGALNGLVVAKVRVNALITTLGTMQIFRGIAVGRGGDRAAGWRRTACGSIAMATGGSSPMNSDRGSYSASVGPWTPTAISGAAAARQFVDEVRIHNRRKTLCRPR